LEGKESSYKNGSLSMLSEEPGVSDCCSDEPCYILWIRIPLCSAMSWHFLSAVCCEYWWQSEPCCWKSVDSI